MPHHPDLFHVDQDINRALVLHLDRARKTAEEAGDGAAVAEVERWQEARADAVALLGESYHPYHPFTGKPQHAADLDAALQTAFDELQQRGGEERGAVKRVKPSPAVA